MDTLLTRKKGNEMRTLAIDTSNQTLTIGVVENQRVLGQIQSANQKNHSVSLMPAIDGLTKSLGLTAGDFDRIVVAKGPGSYTGLRIGVTTAKTLAYTLQKELVGVSSLQTIAANCIGISGLIVPLFDARRKNVYTGGYRWQNGELISVIPDQHIALTDLISELKTVESVFFVGSDVSHFKEELEANLPQASFNQNPLWDLPSGAVLAQLGEQTTEVIEDIQSFTPSYFKRVEAEENWLKNHTVTGESYIEKL